MRPVPYISLLKWLLALKYLEGKAIVRYAVDNESLGGIVRADDWPQRTRDESGKRTRIAVSLAADHRDVVFRYASAARPVTPMTTINGSCLCGSVKYRAATDVRHVVNCHCGLCRRMNGSAFSSYAVVPFKALDVFGEQNLAAYAVTQRATKKYCAKCGTPIFNLNSKYPGACMLYLGAIEGGDRYAPSVNVYCESMLSWLENVTSMQGFPTRIERGG
jgi:hypothetical protein